VNQYKRNLQRYSLQAGHLTLVEHGVLLRLTDLYLSEEKPLAGTRAQLCQKLGARTQSEAQAVNDVLDQFFIEGPDGFRRAELDDTIAESHRRAKISRENGARGGRPQMFSGKGST
jgi:uncharacterized protein YdaU (DUF1376 family)